MKVIGLTGGIGTGKSTVADILARLGAVVVEADKLGHEVLQDELAKRELVTAFGKDILLPDSSVDHKKLAARAFSNHQAVATLNNIVHPRMYGKTVDKLNEYRAQGKGVVVLDAPLLIEAGIVHLVDEVWVTVAPEAVVLERIRKRSGLTDEQALARIRAQLSNEERRRFANIVIETDCTLEELESRVKKEWARLVGNSKE
jgi:dephospho-CoA kinase